MVKYRPTLINYYVNLLYMLGYSKTLNTSEHLFYSKKVKDITMSHQQETKYLSTLNINRLGSSETTQEGSFIVLPHERLRYSPTNIKNKLNLPYGSNTGALNITGSASDYSTEGMISKR